MPGLGVTSTASATFAPGFAESGATDVSILRCAVSCTAPGTSSIERNSTAKRMTLSVHKKGGAAKRAPPHRGQTQAPPAAISILVTRDLIPERRGAAAGQRPDARALPAADQRAEARAPGCRSADDERSGADRSGWPGHDPTLGRALIDDARRNGLTLDERLRVRRLRHVRDGLQRLRAHRLHVT